MRAGLEYGGIGGLIGGALGFLAGLGGRGLDWGERLGNGYVGALMGMPVGLLVGGAVILGWPALSGGYRSRAAIRTNPRGTLGRSEERPMRAILLALTLGLIPMLAPMLAHAQEKAGSAAQIDYRGFRGLTAEVECLPRWPAGPACANSNAWRASPARSFSMRARPARLPEGHIAGAVNLPFTDFTDQSLRAALRDPNMRILIYCNNNFSNNAAPVVLKRVELALNIQTFINLYGYGYRNVYELGDVVDFNDPAVRWVRG